jgi:predicted ArsR family transcriptional regulator
MTLPSRRYKLRTLAETEEPLSPDENETQSKSRKVYKLKNTSRFYAELRRKAEAEVKVCEHFFLS